MILSEQIDNAVETSEEFESQEFSIDTQSLGILFKGFSDSLYSNKIGSIVREITSNCFDSHIEAGITRDVEIEIVNESFNGNQAMIIFRDFGVGLSPDRITNIYRKYFASTKRDNNDAIGGFGIGAKSPLSYVDIFTVVTRFDGLEYTYMVHRGITVPELKLVDKKATNAHNGTEVIINIKNNIDKNKFKDELKKQLMYFDGITFINCDIENDYKIYEGKYFLYRQNQNIYPNTHIVIGKVAYPIDFDMRKEKFNSWGYNAPIAVKFDIGEITVTMSRESIEYTDATIEAIENKLTLAFDELQKIYDSKVRLTDDLLVAIRYSKHVDIIELAPGVEIPGYRNLSCKDFKYIPFKDIPINLSGDIFSKFVEIKCYITSSGEKKDNGQVINKNVTNLFLFLNKEKIYISSEKITKRKSSYIADTINSGYYVISINKDWRKSFSNSTSISEDDLQIIHDEVIKTILSYCKNYDEVDIDKEWLDDYLASIKTDIKVYKDTSDISVKKLSFVSYQNSKMDEVFVMDTYKMAYLAKFCQKGNMIVYATQDNTEELVRAGAILSAIPYFINKNYNGVVSFHNDKIMVIKVSQETAKKLKKLPYTVNAVDFFEKYKKLVIRTLCACMIARRSNNIIHLDDIRVIAQLPQMQEKYDSILEFVGKYYYAPNSNKVYAYLSTLCETFKEDIDYRYFPKKKDEYYDVYYYFNKLQEMYNNLSFLSRIGYNRVLDGEYIKELREYLVFKKVLIKTIEK